MAIACALSKTDNTTQGIRPDGTHLRWIAVGSGIRESERVLFGQEEEYGALFCVVQLVGLLCRGNWGLVFRCQDGEAGGALEGCD